MALKRDVTYSGRFNAASTEHPQGGFKNRTSPTSEDGSYLEQQWLNDWDGFMSSLLSENSIVPNGLVDEVGASQYFEGMLRLREVSPRNNDWNGYLDPEHTVQLQKLDTSAGTRSFNLDDELTPNLFVGAAGTSITFASDGWSFTGWIYKEYNYTAAQLALIDVNKVPVYLKGPDGSEHFASNSTTGVTVEKIGGKLRVTIADTIFAALGIAKLWRFFVTEKIGRVVEVGTSDVVKLLLPTLLLARTVKVASYQPDVTYTNSKPYPISIYITATTNRQDIDLAGNTNGVEVARFISRGAAPSVSVTLDVQPSATFRFSVATISGATRIKTSELS